MTPTRALAFLTHTWLALALPQNDVEPDPHAPLPRADPYIMCLGAPPSPLAGWPPYRPFSSYVSNQQLCAAVGGAQYHLGCDCATAGGPVLCSLAHGGDYTLFTARMNPNFADGHDTFKGFCLDSCICRDAWTGTDFQQYTPAQQAATRFDESVPSAHTFINGTLPNDPFGNLPAEVGSSGTVPDGTDVEMVDLCNQPCTTGTMCHATGCLCRVTGAQWMPSVGQIEYKASCTHSLLDKRGELAPCPCNSTYVSHACCDARDGMVWEDQRLKLGELVEEDI